MAESPNGIPWMVVDQRQTTKVTTSGRFQDVWEVTIQTVDEVQGTLEIPASQYSAETVAEAGGLLADQIAQVQSL